MLETLSWVCNFVTMQNVWFLTILNDPLIQILLKEVLNLTAQSEI